MELQKLPLDLTFGWVVSGQGDVCCDEVQVDWTRLQPDRASQQRGLTHTQRLTQTLTLSGWLQPDSLAMLLDVLANVYILHHSTDALPHRLVVQVAVGYTNDRSLGGEKNRSLQIRTTSYIFINEYLENKTEYLLLIALMLAAQPCSTMKRSTPSMASRVMVYFSSSDVRQWPGRQLIWKTNII